MAKDKKEDEMKEEKAEMPKKKKDYKDYAGDYKNIYFSTTIFAVIGTIIYALIAYFFFAAYVGVTNVLIFFVVVWIVYFLLVKKFRKDKY